MSYYENDHTDAELDRRAHDYEMGAESNEERRWSRFFDAATKAIILKGWGPTLDENEWDAGYSIDGAYDAFEAGQTVDQYIEAVAAKRRSMDLSA